ncbi:hypothetical protein HYW53_00515 [Candidatus Giovannonibacteria bacterium]|nr:hypothetical protein [Candidatus Giovannonibacteria bacterium]
MTGKLTILILALILVVIGVFSYIFLPKPQPPSADEQEDKFDENAELTVNSDWKVFCDFFNGYSIRYPNNLAVVNSNVAYPAAFNLPSFLKLDLFENAFVATNLPNPEKPYDEKNFEMSVLDIFASLNIEFDFPHPSNSNVFEVIKESLIKNPSTTIAEMPALMHLKNKKNTELNFDDPREKIYSFIRPAVKEGNTEYSERLITITTKIWNPSNIQKYDKIFSDMIASFKLDWGGMSIKDCSQVY